MGEVQDFRWALLDPEPSQTVIVVDGDMASLRNGRIEAQVVRNPWHQDLSVSYYDERGRLLVADLGPQGAINLRSRAFKPLLGGPYKLTQTWAANEGEKFYGMGQYQQELLDLNHCTLELAQRNSQASVPFVLSNRGYGLLWHNPAVGRVTFGANKVEWVAESTLQLDYWITAGESPAAIEEAYARATGTVPMMPEYGLGFWQCKLRYWNQEQLLAVAREHKRRGLPIDVIVCDFFHWPFMGDFRFDQEFFPDPKAMVDELKTMGIELMVSVWPQIDYRSENFSQMREQGLLIQSERGVNISMRFGGESVYFDATNPRARDYVWRKIRDNYYDLGIKVFWLDEAEPEYNVYDFDNYRYHAGPNLQVGNVYPQQFSQTFFDGLRAEGHDQIVNLVRCAWAGSQRYGALVWSGDILSDFATLRRQLCAGLNMGIAGIPWWTTDIGGFMGGNGNDPRFRQLLVRWFQWATFCPVMRLHGDRDIAPELRDLKKRDGSSALFTGGDNEVWSYGPEVYGILERYLRLRERLRPYTRSLMRAAHEKGTPIMRPLFYEFPDDLTCWDTKDEYLFGPDILVAPVVWEDAFVRDVYLPQGAFWTDVAGRVYAGGQTITVEAPLETIPLFFCEGRQKELLCQPLTTFGCATPSSCLSLKNECTTSSGPRTTTPGKGLGSGSTPTAVPIWSDGKGPFPSSGRPKDSGPTRTSGHPKCIVGTSVIFCLPRSRPPEWKGRARFWSPTPPWVPSVPMVRAPSRLEVGNAWTVPCMSRPESLGWCSAGNGYKSAMVRSTPFR